MRELTVRIRFTSPSLGNVKKRGRGNDGKYYLPRHPDERITYLAAWHHANLRTAAQLLNKHHKLVKEIRWDIFVDGCPPKGGARWFRRYYTQQGNGKRRFSQHECFPAGHVIGINCAVPIAITDDDMNQLMGAAGRYCGLSPWSPNEFGHFEVVSIRPRRSNTPRAKETPEAAETILTEEDSES